MSFEDDSQWHDGHLAGIRDAIEVIRGMNTMWPDAIAAKTAVRDIGREYAEQFVSRILESFPEANPR